MSAEQTLATLGLQLPAAGAAIFAYVPVKRVGDVAYVSGLVSRSVDGAFIMGRLEPDSDVAAGTNAARACGLHLLAAARSITGSLDDIEIVKLLVLVNAAPGFVHHASVADGCSKLLLEVLGSERGGHARSAIGVASLPANVTVEVEAVIRVLG